MIISQTIIRNEKERFLKKWLAGNMPYFDKMIIYDDASDDGTSETIKALNNPKIILVEGKIPTFKTNENQLRTSLWEEVRKVGKEGDWVMTLDSDEIVCPEFKEMVPKLDIFKPMLVSFKKIEMWDKENYRTDGFWSNYFDRAFPFKNEPFGFTGEGFHYPSIPSYSFYSRWNIPVYQSNCRILHLGYETEELRKQKYDFMMANKQQEKDITFYHLQSINERPPVLKKYTPEYEFPRVLIVACATSMYDLPDKFLEWLETVDYDKKKMGMIFMSTDCNYLFYKKILNHESKFPFHQFRIINYEADQKQVLLKRDAISICYQFKEAYDYFFIHDIGKSIGGDWLKHLTLIEGNVAIPFFDSVNEILISREALECLDLNRFGHSGRHPNIEMIDTFMKGGYLVWGGIVSTPFPINSEPDQAKARMK